MLRLLFLIIFFSFNLCFAHESSDEIQTQICSPTACYTVIEELGEGAFGKVYSVKDSEDNRFAIKCYKTSEYSLAGHVLADPEREFERGQMLDHPNIIKVFDHFISFQSDEETISYLVLELVEGNTLLNTTKGSIPYTAAANITAQLVNALEYAFSLDLLHLDLHEDNVMVDSNFNLKVIDVASFYSLEELSDFMKAESKTISRNSTSPITLYFQKGLLLQPETKKTDFQPLIESERHLKLRAFFKKHPQLFSHMQKIYKQDQQPLFNPLFNKGIDSASENKKSRSETFRLGDNSFIHSYYLDYITEICRKIIIKSELDRNTKINISAEIKKLAWHYLEDIEDGMPTSFLEYLNQIIVVVQSFPFA